MRGPLGVRRSRGDPSKGDWKAILDTVQPHFN